MVKVARFPRHFAFPPVLACFLGALLVTGCGNPANSTQSGATATSNSAPAEAVGPGAGEKVCFACDGTGMVKCPAPGCVNGQVPCPGPCLKLSKGIWRHTDIDGKPSDILWQIFNSPDGRETFAVNEHHLGEVLVYQDGKFQLIGKCKICGGTGKVTCSVCKGTGKVTCPICQGKKFVPVAWTPTDNPYFNSQPDIIRLADGRVILGRVAGTVGDERIIVTRDKKVLHVKASDILPKTETSTNTPAAQTSPSI